MISSNGWATSNTLGFKEKLFKWRIDNNKLEIYREMKNGPECRNVTLFDLDHIHSYVSKNNWTHLANSVSKIPNGTEKEGIGKYMYEELRLPVSDAQLASHISALFCQAGIWVSNGVVKGMMFRKVKDDWKTAIMVK
jgi:hypothetical protein